jgi:hypothetical protein
MGEVVPAEGADLENTEEPKQKSNLRKGAITVLSAAAGWAIAQYFGASLLLIPFAGFIVVFILARVVKKSEAPFLNAVAFQFAHLAWFTVGAVFTRQYIGLLDVFVIAPFLLWLVARPSKVPAYVLLVINSLSILYNLVQLVGANPDVVKPLLAHLLIRVAVIASLIYGLRRFTPNAAIELEPTDPTPIEPGHDLHYQPNLGVSAGRDPRERGSRPLNTDR